MRTAVRLALFVVSLSIVPAAEARQDDFYALPDLAREIEFGGGMRAAVERYTTDLRALQRWWDVPFSVQRRARERAFFEAWRSGLDALAFEDFGTDDRVDWLLLQNRLEYELRRLEADGVKWTETEPLLPFAAEIAGLQEARRSFEPHEPAVLAERLDALVAQVESVRTSVRLSEPDEEEGDAGDSGAADTDAVVVDKLVANRAAGEVRQVQETLRRWYRYFAGYDPMFTWWCERPYDELDEALGDYARYLRETLVGVDEDDTDTILGDPIGREALLSSLKREWIPYTPERLVEIAESEFDWCDREMLRAAQDLGFGDDWRAALEHVKGLHVEPGEQPELIRMLAWEAIEFLEANDLLTIPPFAKTSWRMEMMSPQAQKFTPYFTGGEVIRVSFPTGGMAHENKLMSLRGNNVHFSRATVQHELIPGHHLQQFMNSRYKRYRGPFSTPFWGEGWALYWEMLLWDLDFPQSAEDRVGMLFWRRHRCARIIFSLNFQLGEWTPQECIEFLMERVGHEKANATAEVRRSVQGGYGPLYQAAYMLGGLQFRALHAELVGSGDRSNRDFHDAILRQGSIPVEMVRAILTGQELGRDFASAWRFYD